MPESGIFVRLQWSGKSEDYRRLLVAPAVQVQ